MLVSEEVGVATRVTEADKVGEREPPPAAGPEPKISVESMGVELGD